eukprot:augustus_masked-scaffold_14-processed-gene-7.6-mRNA-1 protein AED:1.00 eAED:1.00 QI:0/-1/0/0/-1/1/1/0/1005
MTTLIHESSEIFPKPERIRFGRRRTSVLNTGSFHLPLGTGKKASLSPFTQARRTKPLGNTLSECHVNGVFLVEENKDKKKPFSDEWWVDPFKNQKIIGNVWKTRVFVASSTAIALFKVKKNLAFDNFGFEPTGSELLDFSDVIVRYIKVDDIVAVTELKETPDISIPDDSGFLIHIVQTKFNGRFSSILRAPNEQIGREIMSCIEKTRNTFRLARMPLDKGIFKFDDNAKVLEAIRIVNVVDRNGKVLAGLLPWGGQVDLSVEPEHHGKVVLLVTALTAAFEPFKFEISGEKLLEKEAGKKELNIVVLGKGTENKVVKAVIPSLYLFLKVSEYPMNSSRKIDVSNSLVKLVEEVRSIVAKSPLYYTLVAILFGVVIGNLSFGSIFIVSVCCSVLFLISFKDALEKTLVDEIIKITGKQPTHQVILERVSTCPKQQVVESKLPAPRFPRPNLESMLSDTQFTPTGSVETEKEDVPPALGNYRRQRSQSNLSQYTREDRKILYNSIASSPPLQTHKIFNSSSSSYKFSGSDNFDDKSFDEMSAPGHLPRLGDLLESIEDVEPDVMKVPFRWMEAAKGDRSEGFKLWQRCIEWRREKNIDEVIKTPQPKFKEIKQEMPHLLLGNDSDGNLCVLLDISNVKEKFQKLHGHGVHPEIFSLHHVFVQEFWIKGRLTRTGQIKQIIDLKGVSFFSFNTLVLSYLSASKDIFVNYPECLVAIYLVNVPTSFKMIWKVVSPFLDKNTLSKIRVFTGKAESWKKKLRTEMPVDILPVSYGGDHADEPSSYPIEKGLEDFVKSLPARKDFTPLEIFGRSLSSERKTDTDGSTVSVQTQEEYGIHKFIGEFHIKQRDLHLCSSETIVALTGRRGKIIQDLPLKLLHQSLKLKLKKKINRNTPDKVFIKLTTFLGPLKTVIYADYFENEEEAHLHMSNAKKKFSPLSLRKIKAAAFLSKDPDSNQPCLKIFYLHKDDQKTEINIRFDEVDRREVIIKKHTSISREGVTSPPVKMYSVF